MSAIAYNFRSPALFGYANIYDSGKHHDANLCWGRGGVIGLLPIFLFNLVLSALVLQYFPHHIDLKVMSHLRSSELWYGRPPFRLCTATI